MRRADALVVGGGAMGSAAAWWLARRGRAVILLERFERGHTRGSSHGGSRIFRLAYPDPLYVRMAVGALDLWRALEHDAGEPLLDHTGAIDHGDAASVAAVAGALQACGVEHEMLAPGAAQERWPGMRFEGEVLVHAAGGRVRADATVRALQDRAVHHGAEARTNEAVLLIEPRGSHVYVHTPVDSYEAPVAVVTAGSWAARLLGDLVTLPPLTVTQEQVFHFAARDGTAWPSFIHHRDPIVYGLETPGEGVKVAEHHTGRTVDPDTRDGVVDASGRDRVERYVAAWFPGLDPVVATEATCLYTTTPTEDFVIDRVGPLVVGAGFSGHGFKFVPLVGRLLADLAAGRPGPGERFRLRAS